MSKIINLKIENCGDCIFSFYELRKNGKEGLYCRASQTPFFLGKISGNDAKIILTEINKNCPLPDKTL